MRWPLAQFLIPDTSGVARFNSWFYIGFLPLLALAFLPLTYNKARWHRSALSTLAVLKQRLWFCRTASKRNIRDCPELAEEL
jgi:hypothetical protein